MIWTLLAGLLAGFSIGFVGAGGAVIGLPFFLYLLYMPPHTALGTNAMGVAFIVTLLMLWRVYKGDSFLKEGFIYTFIGLLGVWVGSHIGILFPGKQLIFLLGFLLFGVAGWMFYLSHQLSKTSQTNATSKGANSQKEWILLGVLSLITGGIAGFLAVGCGFLIIPGIMVATEMELTDAIATGLIPFSLFSLWIGFQNWQNGAVVMNDSLFMLLAGAVGGWLGIQLSKRLSQKFMQRVFAVLMLLLGSYMIIQ